MSPSESSEPVATTRGSVGGVDVESIERELAALGLGTGEHADDSLIHRACMSNLLVFARGAKAEASLMEEIEPIVRAHPARVLLMIAGVDALGDGLDAGVTALCYRGEGARQICSETVTVRAGPGAERRLASVIRPLVIGDLPTTLWWASPEPPTDAGALFSELAAMADHVLYDSGAWSEAGRGLTSVAQWLSSAARRGGLSDLAWTRIRPWRRLVAQATEPFFEQGRLEEICEVHLDHGPNGTTQAWLVAGWLASRLGWGDPRPEGDGWRFTSTRQPAAIRIRSRVDSTPEGMCGIELCFHERPGPDSIQVRREQSGRVAVEYEGVCRYVHPLPDLSRAELVAAELPSLGQDKIAHDSLEMVRRMLPQAAS